MYFNQLRDNLFATVHFPQELSELMKQVGVWRDFCKLSPEIKQQFAFSDEQVEIDPGYKIRSRVGGREDKEYFHYLPINKDILVRNDLELAARQTPEVQHFFDFSEQLFNLTDPLIEGIAQDLSAEIPEIVEIVRRSKPNRIIRFLHYTPQDSAEKMLADQHFDRSGFTLHLYESHLGLELLDWNMQWIPAPMGEGKTITFTGYQMEQLTKGVCQKTWHRVLKNESLRDTTRISVVLFVPFTGVISYDQSTRSQDQIPGYHKI